MKLFLAAQYKQKEELLVYANELKQMGFDICSSWLYSDPSGMEGGTEDEEACAHRDLDDIEECDIFVFFSVGPTTPTIRGSRHVEYGYALCWGKPILVIGPKENLYHHFKNRIRHVETWQHAKIALEYEFI